MSMSERQFNDELEKIWKEAVVGLSMYLTGNNWRVEEDQDKHVRIPRSTGRESNWKPSKNDSKRVAAEPY